MLGFSGGSPQASTTSKSVFRAVCRLDRIDPLGATREKRCGRLQIRAARWRQCHFAHKRLGAYTHSSRSQERRAIALQSMDPTHRPIIYQLSQHHFNVASPDDLHLRHSVQNALSHSPCFACQRINQFASPDNRSFFCLECRITQRTRLAFV